LVVSVELPTLSFQPDDVSIGNLVSSAIFGDGAAAVLLEASSGPGLRIVATHCDLVPNTLGAVGFDLHADGFHVVLAKELSALVRSEFCPLAKDFLGRTGVDLANVTAFILHPGGRKILEAIEEGLGLDRHLTQPSWDVLRRHGNTSSAAVLFVLHEWLRRPLPRSSSYGLLAAFGPGLTTELLLLQWE
jgi:alkylresorcinol/alkylpyrone synthase